MSLGYPHDSGNPYSMRMIITYEPWLAISSHYEWLLATINHSYSLLATKNILMYSGDQKNPMKTNGKDPSGSCRFQRCAFALLEVSTLPSQTAQGRGGCLQVPSHGHAERKGGGLVVKGRFLLMVMIMFPLIIAIIVNYCYNYYYYCYYNY